MRYPSSPRAQDVPIMKDLMLILEAVRQAQETLAEYLESSERNPDATIRELSGILNNPDVASAMRQVYPLIDSPSVAPDVNAAEKLHKALPGS
jgi:hypothetical protein